MFNYSTNNFYKQFILLIAFLCIGLTAKADFAINGANFASTKWDADYNGGGECVYHGDWKGIGWWFGDQDLSSYASLTVNFSSGTASKVVLKIQFTDDSTEETFMNAGATSITLNLNSSKCAHVKQIYLQTENACTIYVSGISLVGATAQQYSLSLAANDAARGTVSGAGTFYEGSSVTITATAEDGYKFSRWIDAGGNSVATAASYTFPMPSEDASYTAVFIDASACETTLEMEWEDYVDDVTIIQNASALASSIVVEHGTLYGAASNNSYVDFKAQASEIFLPFSVHGPHASYAADFTIQLRYANVTDGWLRAWKEVASTDPYDIMYDGKYYKELTSMHFYQGGEQKTWQTFTHTWSIFPGLSGRWLFSVQADDYAAFDKVTITSANPLVTFCDYEPVPLEEHALTLSTTPADGSWGTAASNQPDDSAIEERTSVTVTATPAAGYYFSAWMNGTTKVSGSAVYTFVMPNEDYTLTAVFTDEAPAENCDATLHIEAEDFVNVTVKSTGTATSAQTVAEQGTPKYGTARNDAIAWFKGSNSEVYYPFSVSDAVGNITFTVKLADAKNTWLNLWELSTISDYDIEYNGQYYKKYHDGKSLSATEYGQTWEKPTVSYSNLPLGQYLVSIYGENWTAIDYIEAVSSNPSTNYCVAVLPKHTVTATANDAAYGSVSPAVSSVEEGKNITVRATPEDGYSFVCWESDDITLTEQQKHKPLLSVPMGTSDITLTANFAPVYTAWPWHDGISEWSVTNSDHSDKGCWDNQVTLGPEHFTTAVVGGKILVKVSSMGNKDERCYLDPSKHYDVYKNPQGAFQNTTDYNTIDRYGKAYDEASGQELYSGWEDMRDSLGSAWDFDLKNGNFYHTITATSLAELQLNGVIIKGQHYTISEIQIIGTCDDRDMRSAPTVDTAKIVYDYTATTTTNNYVWWPGFPDDSKKGVDEFCFGNWEHKLKFPASAFAQISVGDIIRIRVRQVDSSKRCRISYRCDIPWIDALANQTTHAGQTVKTTGDISFDRTITNLGGDAPDPEGYVDMRVDADMLARLKETGLIIFGENACLSMVEICHGPYIILSNEERYVPKCGVDSLIIYQGGQAMNTDYVKVYAGVEYVRPAVGGKHGNLIDHWYTFTVPYEVTKTKVLDEEDKNLYDINCVYHKEGDDRDNPTGVGYFYLQSLTSDGDNTGIDDIFRARWDYIYETQPQALEPYIIMFTNYGDGYFASNPTIKFCGGPCEISGINQIKTVPASGVEYWMYPNNTMHDITIPGSAYVLNEGTNLFELEDNPTIAPFECYVQATAGFKALHPVIAHPGYVRTNNNSATSVGDTQGWSLSIINDGQSKVLLSAIDQTVCIFSAVGQMVASVRLQSGEAQTLSLPRGTYIINTVDGPRKVMF